MGGIVLAASTGVNIFSWMAGIGFLIFAAGIGDGTEGAGCLGVGFILMALGLLGLAIAT